MTSTYNDLIYMEDHEFIFAYVPKVVCSNWKSLMRYMSGHQDWPDIIQAYNKQDGGLRYINPGGPNAALLKDSGIRTLSEHLNKAASRLPVQPETEGED